MLSKLLKYEIKATSRKFFPIYGGIFAASVLTNIALNFLSSDVLRVITFIILISFFAALGVLTITTVIQRFKDNLFGDEGYLMLTIPTSPEKIILSKAITALIWAILSGIMAVISLIIVLLNNEFISALKTFIQNFGGYFAEFITTRNVITAILFGICLLSQYIYFVLTVYTSLSIAQTPAFIKRRGLSAFLWFLGISVIVSMIVMKVSTAIFPDNAFTAIHEMTPPIIWGIFTNLFFGTIMLFVTSYIIRNHLNLE